MLITMIFSHLNVPLLGMIGLKNFASLSPSGYIQIILTMTKNIQNFNRMCLNQKAYVILYNFISRKGEIEKHNLK